MAIVRFGERPNYRNPWAEFEKMRREMDSLSKRVLGGGPSRDYANVYPALLIIEDENAIHVEAEVAGVRPEDVEISIEGETLTLKGERKAPTSEEKVSYHRREVEYGTFNRAVTLPTRIKVDKITARSVNGILYITLPKAEEVKPKKINVTVG
ncbi:MAG: Hsp20/alpha crystallin family protein [Deltaproteobacteria bacterium]